MLGVKTYTKQYIDDCRAKIEADLAAYRALAATSNGPALVKFETRYFNCMVLVLEMMFVVSTSRSSRKICLAARAFARLRRLQPHVRPRALGLLLTVAGRR
jgi:hypothetical protein